MNTADKRYGTIGYLNDLMSRYGITARKQYGQNFLCERSVIDRIVQPLKLDDTVIEIGTGLGSLTGVMAEKVRRVIGFEIDETLAEILKTELADHKNVEIFNRDFLKIDLESLLQSFDGKVSVVSNLPYYITTELLTLLFRHSSHIDKIIAMMQKEVAERFTKADHGKQYGPLQLMAPYYSKISSLTRVSRHNFIPAPKVDSEVLLFEMRPYCTVVEDDDRLWQIVEAAFAQRRKYAVSNLTKSGFHILRQQLHDININESARPDELTLDDYIRIYEVLTDEKESLRQDKSEH